MATPFPCSPSTAPHRRFPHIRSPSNQPKTVTDEPRTKPSCYTQARACNPKAAVAALPCAVNHHAEPVLHRETQQLPTPLLPGPDGDLSHAGVASPCSHCLPVLRRMMEEKNKKKKTGGKKESKKMRAGRKN
jgi:hypothetical protein